MFSKLSSICNKKIMDNNNLFFAVKDNEDEVHCFSEEKEFLNYKSKEGIHIDISSYPISQEGKSAIYKAIRKGAKYFIGPWYKSLSQHKNCLEPGFDFQIVITGKAIVKNYGTDNEIKESAEDAIKREMEEEVGLYPTDVDELKDDVNGWWTFNIKNTESVDHQSTIITNTQPTRDNKQLHVASVLYATSIQDVKNYLSKQIYRKESKDQIDGVVVVPTSFVKKIIISNINANSKLRRIELLFYLIKEVVESSKLNVNDIMVSNFLKQIKLQLYILTSYNKKYCYEIPSYIRRVTQQNNQQLGQQLGQQIRQLRYQLGPQLGQQLGQQLDQLGQQLSKIGQGHQEQQLEQR